MAIGPTFGVPVFFQTGSPILVPASPRFITEENLDSNGMPIDILVSAPLPSEVATWRQQEWKESGGPGRVSVLAVMRPRETSKIVARFAEETGLSDHEELRLKAQFLIREVLNSISRDVPGKSVYESQFREAVWHGSVTALVHFLERVRVFSVYRLRPADIEAPRLKILENGTPWLDDYINLLQRHQDAGSLMTVEEYEREVPPRERRPYSPIVRLLRLNRHLMSPLLLQELDLFAPYMSINTSVRDAMEELPYDWGEPVGKWVVEPEGNRRYDLSSGIGEDSRVQLLAALEKEVYPPFPFKDAGGRPDGSLLALLAYLQSIGFFELTDEFRQPRLSSSLKKDLVASGLLTDFEVRHFEKALFKSYHDADRTVAGFLLYLMKKWKSPVADPQNVLRARLVRVFSYLQENGFWVIQGARTVPPKLMMQILNRAGVPNKALTQFADWMATNPHDTDLTRWLSLLDPKFWDGTREYRQGVQKRTVYTSREESLWETFADALECYRETEKVSRGPIVFLVDGGGSEKHSLVLPEEMLLALSENQALPQAAIPDLAHVFIAYARSRHPDLADQILCDMDDYYGGRLEWDNRLAALEEVGLSEILSLNPEAAWHFHAGNEIFLHPGDSLLESGFFTPKWLLFTERGASSAYVSLKKMGDEAVITGHGGRNADRLAEILVRRKIANILPQVAVRVEPKTDSVGPVSVTPAAEVEEAALAVLKEALLYYTSQESVKFGSALNFKVRGGIPSDPTRGSKIHVGTEVIQSVFKNSAISESMGPLVMALGDYLKEKNSALYARFVEAMDARYGHRLGWDLRFGTLKEAIERELALMPEEPLYLILPNHFFITDNGLMGGEVRFQREPFDKIRHNYVKVVIVDGWIHLQVSHFSRPVLNTMRDLGIESRFVPRASVRSERSDPVILPNSGNPSLGDKTKAHKGSPQILAGGATTIHVLGNVLLEEPAMDEAEAPALPEKKGRSTPGVVHGGLWGVPLGGRTSILTRASPVLRLVH